MKMVFKRDLAKDRAAAREIINNSYSAVINRELGSRAQLHSFKGHLANVGIDVLGDPDAIKAKMLETAERIKPIEDERQDIQARIDSATTALDIDAIVADVVERFGYGR